MAEFRPGVLTKIGLIWIVQILFRFATNLVIIGWIWEWIFLSYFGAISYWVLWQLRRKLNFNLVLDKINIGWIFVGNSIRFSWIYFEFWTWFWLNFCSTISRLPTLFFVWLFELEFRSNLRYKTFLVIIIDSDVNSII